MALKDVLNAAGEIALYTHDPEWKRKRMADALAEAESIARVRSSNANADALAPRLGNARKRNVINLLNAVKQGQFSPDQIEAVAGTLDDPEDQEQFRLALPAFQRRNEAAVGSLEAGIKSKQASAEKTKADTIGEAEKEARAALAAERVKGAKRKNAAPVGGAAKPKDTSGRAAALRKELRAWSAKLDSGDVSQATFDRNTQAISDELDKLEGGSVQATATAAGVKKSKEKPPLPAVVPAPESSAGAVKIAGRAGTSADVGSGELSRNRDKIKAVYSKLPPAAQSQFRQDLKRLGLGNPDEFLR